MPQSDPALAIRVSSQQREDLQPHVDVDRPRLRLLVTKGRLGVELDAPFEMGPLRIEEMALSFPHVKFPVELSGGVDTFRNRRGQLERLVVKIPGPAAHRFARAALNEALGGTLLHHVVAPLEDGWLVGVATDVGALAFEVMLAPLDGDLRLIPTRARSVGFREAPQALAMRVLARLLGEYGRDAGSAIIVERAPMEIAQAMLPLAGMRAPAARVIRWTELAHDLDGATLTAEREGAPLELTERAVSTVELAALIADAERSLLSGDLDSARRSYLGALTRAPRHPEIACRLAELDRAVGGRAEAALSTLVEVMPPVDAGPLGAALLARVGDQAGAAAAWRRAAAAEPFGPLAGMCWMELGRASDGDASERALDEAIARAPVLVAARWLRFENLVRRGRIDDARADVEHLEAQAEGATARVAVLRRAADFMLEERALSPAGDLYERALRYAPADVASIAGLSASLSLLGHRRRALELLSRAAGIVDARGEAAPRVRLDYARALAEVADDRPAAIARVAGIEHLTAACFEARLFEARWRAELGDLAGAHASLARFADAVEAVMGALVDATAAGVAERLWSGPGALYRERTHARSVLAALAEEGARIHELDRGDAFAARRLLEMAMRLAPRSRSIRAGFKRVAAVTDRGDEGQAKRAAPAREADEHSPPTEQLPRAEPPPKTEQLPRTEHLPATEHLSAHEPSDPPDAPLLDIPAPEESSAPALSDTLAGDDLDRITLEARAETLSERVRGNPNDTEVVNELIEVLEQLNRHHELLALLSARVDEAPEQERESFIARRKGVLRRMITLARADGRDDEAELYELMMDA